MTTVSKDAGLRERKRAATREAIVRAALDLILEHGYDHVTVDMICRASDVSQRTFFNYFGSKEGVIVGALPPFPDDDAVASFVHETGTPVLEGFLDLVFGTFAELGHDRERERVLRLVVQRNPELAATLADRMRDYEDQSVSILLDRFAAEGRTPDTEADLEDEAHMIVGLTTAVMFFAMRKQRGGAPDADQVRRLPRVAVALIRRAVGDTRNVASTSHEGQGP